MKRSFFWLFTVGTLFSLLVAVPNLAFGKKPAARRHQTVISSITPTSITIQEDNGPKTFMITQFTEVNVNGQKATVANLKPGMRVSVTLEDPLHLRQINASSMR